MQAFSHCHFCGSAFTHEQTFPKLCASCGNFTYRNPLPVSVVLLPIAGGLLTVRRAIEPRKGQLALPGGFINYGESWQAAGARELMEETNIVVEPATSQLFTVLSAPDSTLLVFGLVQANDEFHLPDDFPRDETEELVVIQQPEILAFPLHTQAVAQYFAGAIHDSPRNR